MKPKKANPKMTALAEAYKPWMDALNPMVTFFKTLDVTHAGSFLHLLQENIRKV